MHSRRGFVTLSLGAGLLGSGLVSAAGCDKSTPETQPEPRTDLPSSAPPPAPPLPSMVDLYEPRFDRIHSASAYETLVSKSVAFELARQHTRDATVEARQDTSVATSASPIRSRSCSTRSTTAARCSGSSSC